MSKGKEKLKESLSALMDNEASEFEFRRVLKESAVDHEIKLKWQRYHLISAAIKGECGNSPAQHSRQPDLLARINAELDGESSQHILTAEAYPNEKMACKLPDRKLLKQMYLFLMVIMRQPNLVEYLV